MNRYDIPKIVGKKKELPDYEEKFGHLAEKIIMSALSKRDFFVEKVEKGTAYEDYKQKVDFWLKFKGIPDPIGIQYTTNPKKFEQKKEFLRQRGFLARKEKRSDSEIDWSGSANVVVIMGDHAKMINYWKKIEIEGMRPEDVVSDAFIVDFFENVLIELSEVSPPKRNIILKKITEMAKDAVKNKKS